MLQKQIQEDTKTALKAGDSFSLQVLRMASSSISSKQKERRYKISKEKPDMTEEDLVKESALNDEQVMEVVLTEIKKRKDAITLYEQGGRPELADNEKKEIAVLQKYLPEQLSETELRELIKGAIEKTGAKEIKDMGKIMAELMPKVKGKADNAQISKIVKELLGK